VYYIFGRISYYLFDIQPIEDAGFEFDDDVNTGSHATLMDVFRTFNKLMDIQGKIQSGEIKLKDQHASYLRDKAEFERLLEDQRREDDPWKYQTPSFGHLLKTYGEMVQNHKNGKQPVMKIPRAVKKHPLVRQDDGEIPADGEGEGVEPAGPSFTEVVSLIIKYSEFTSIFLWEVQAATVGQIAGNLTICQNSTLTIYNNSIGVYN